MERTLLCRFRWSGKAAGHEVGPMAVWREIERPPVDWALGCLHLRCRPRSRSYAHSGGREHLGRLVDRLPLYASVPATTTHEEWLGANEQKQSHRFVSQPRSEEQALDPGPQTLA
jgi:hypothetical protein